MFGREDAPRVLSEEQVEAIHEQAMRILHEVGTVVLDERARAILADAGQAVEDTRVRWGRAFVEEMVAKAPSSFTLHTRNPARSVTIGEGRPVFAPVGGCPFVSDLDKGRRGGTLENHDLLVKVAHASDLLTCMQTGTVEATDIPVQTRHLHMELSTLPWSDKPYVAYGTAGWKTEDSIAMAAIVHGGREAIERQPVTMDHRQPEQPVDLGHPDGPGPARVGRGEPTRRRHAVPARGRHRARHDGRGPLGPGRRGAVRVALAQIVRPGVPCLYGSFFTALDMRTGSPAFGMPEAVLAILAGRHLADRYGLPYRGGGGFASGNVLDGQSAAEATMSLWGTMLAATDFVLHAAGWIEGGLTASFEKLAFDLEILRQFERMRQGIGTGEDDLAFEAIAEAGPGGMFLASGHTMARFKESLDMSPMFLTTDFATWEPSGGQTVDAGANQAWKQLLESYEDPGLDPAIEEELRTSPRGDSRRGRVTSGPPRNG